MRYHVLATDYDGTIATQGGVPPEVLEALRRLKSSSRRLVLVSGRILGELMEVFPDYGIFDRIVAENGALIFNPATKQEKTIGALPPKEFLDELTNNGVHFSQGRVILGAWSPDETRVFDAIKKFGIEYQVIFNKGAVMILPSGVNKARGLEEALNDLGMCLHNTVAVGDAENDNALLQSAECAVAVANALDTLKERADLVTSAEHGYGVAELIDRLVQNDLADLDPKLQRHYLQIRCTNGENYGVSPYRKGILVAGKPGGGKTTHAIGLIESLMEKHYQFCLVDPEGDYAGIQGVVPMGDGHPPVVDEVIRLLAAGQNVLLSLLGVHFEDRPSFFRELLAKLTALRATTGRPHWLILDEAHHLIPSTTEPSFFNLPGDLTNFVLVTTEPALVGKAILEQTDLLFVIGSEADVTLNSYSSALGIASPDIPKQHLEKGEVLIWDRSKNRVDLITRELPEFQGRHHERKYAQGDLGDRSFYFTGPDGKMNLKAQNLMTFIQLARGIDGDTWMHHLRQKDYSNWLRGGIRDEELADLVSKEEDNATDATASAEAITKLISDRYTGAG